MKIAILIKRLNWLRHVEGILREATKRGHEVTLVPDERQPRTGPKADEWPDLTRAPQRFQVYPVAPLVRQRIFTALAARTLYDVLIIPGPIAYQGHIILPKAHHICALQTSWSDVMYLSDPGRWRAIYIWSTQWRDWWKDAHGFRDSAIMEKFVPVGFPVAEQLRWISHAEVRQTFNLPAGQKVVLYLPLPFGGHDGQSWRLRYGYRWVPWGDRAFCRAVRAFCDRNEALLVVKSRRKTPVPPYLHALADRVVEADEPGEPTLLRLLTCAHLMIHYQSASVCEAVAANVSAQDVAFPSDLWPAYQARIASVAQLALYQWPPILNDGTRNCVRYGYATDWPLYSPAQLCGWDAARTAYLDQFLGGEPFNTGARILDDLEKRCGH